MFSKNPLTQRGVGALTVLLMLTAVTTACGGGETQVEQPLPPPPTPPPPPPPPPAPTTQTGPCDATMQVALQTAIEAREKAELTFGMKKEGTFGCELVAEGGMMTVAVSLQPGRCYTALANSFPNVSEVDLFLKPNLGPSPPPLLASFAGMVMAQDSETGPIASIGAGKNCYKNPFPVPGAAVLEVKARTGSGPVAVQVYSK